MDKKKWPGEGKVIQLSQEEVGVFRDFDSNIAALRKILQGLEKQRHELKMRLLAKHGLPRALGYRFYSDEGVIRRAF